MEIHINGQNFSSHDTNLLKFTLHNIINGNLSEFGQKALFCEVDKQQYALFIYSNLKIDITREMYLFQLETLKKIFHELLHIQTIFHHTRNIISLKELPQQSFLLSSIINVSSPKTLAKISSLDTTDTPIQNSSTYFYGICQ